MVKKRSKLTWIKGPSKQKHGSLEPCVLIAWISEWVLSLHLSMLLYYSILPPSVTAKHSQAPPPPSAPLLQESMQLFAIVLTVRAGSFDQDL